MHPSILGEGPGMRPEPAGYEAKVSKTGAGPRPVPTNHLLILFNRTIIFRFPIN